MFEGEDRCIHEFEMRFIEMNIGKTLYDKFKDIREICKK